MKAQNYLFLLFAVLILSISLVSATLTISSPKLLQTGTAVEITVTSLVDYTISEITASPDPINYKSKTIDFVSPSMPIVLNASIPKIITINYTIQPGFEFDFGQEYPTTLTVKNSSGDQTTQVLSFEETDFCENKGNLGDIDVSIEDITVNGIDGTTVFSDKDTEWYPGEEIEIEVKVDAGNYGLQNIDLEWCLFDADQKKCVMDDTENLEDEDLDDGDDTTGIFKFTITPDDLDPDSTDYELHVRAIGEIDDSDAGVNDGKSTCASEAEDIDIIVGNDFVVLSDIKMSETASCGEEIQITADVWNIGEENQDNVYVVVENSDLDISEQVEVGDIDSFENEDLNLKFSVPKDAKEGSYKLILTVYDENDDVYESEDKGDSIFSRTLKIEGSCNAESVAPKVILTASVESGGQAGKELVVKATLANTGDEKGTFVISAENYGDWAELLGIEPAVVTLAKGESKDILLKLLVNEDASGDKTFNIKATPSAQGQELIQPVSVKIDGKQGFKFGITGGVINEGNWYLWGIGALNIILVIIIIIVAIRVAKS